MMSMPKPVRDYVEALPHPTGLVGCRALDKISHPFCEYDIAVFGDGEDRLERINDHFIELIHIKHPRDHIVTLENMSIIRDSKTFSVSSTLKNITDETFKKALIVSGRRALISSLFCQQKFKAAKEQHARGMWLKIASYHLVAGTLATFGERPMPLHELAQARQAELPADAADGVQVALECIGVERATRPAIARSTEAMLELKAKDYDRALVHDKIEHLLEMSMLTDCYYFIGKALADNLSARNYSFLRRYSKLVQLAMDLSGDEQHLEKMQKNLFLAAKKGLKISPPSITYF